MAGMKPSERSMVTVQFSTSEGNYPSRTGSPQTTNIRFTSSLPVRRPDKPRAELENRYAPPKPQQKLHPSIQSMNIGKSRRFSPPSIRPDLSSRSITPSPPVSPNPVLPYPQEPTDKRPCQMEGFNERSAPLPVASDDSSSASASSTDSSSSNSTSTQATEPAIKNENGNQCQTPTLNVIAPESPPPKANKPASQKQPRFKKNLIPPLTKVHFSCYQSHRYLAASNNVICPVPCMTCLKDDQLIRWRCPFCCLRICGECMQTMQKCKRRSLKELMECLVAALESAAST
ncbi:hypothetical protein ACJ72_04043 [Emergomyces africanus]|uniref:Uncharacterized protein n=1 Tax=Emergomyces africanus TaxID=1955775 RepID=A0A1B7NXW2_9EURO|nr:hypothetical protein ACJ72_04043 [Emergomyces africanus]